VWTTVASALACAAVAVCLYQTVVVTFFKYDDDSYPYVYSHTRREAVELVREVERAGARAGTKEPGVSIVSPEYWPMPWYFRDNSRVGYTSQPATFYDPQTTLMIIGRKSETASEDQSVKLRALLGSAYVEVGTYALRPGVDLVLFERRDLAQR
jgi:predicted membrane-bound mannosyltransferase